MLLKHIKNNIKYRLILWSCLLIPVFSFLPSLSHAQFLEANCIVTGLMVLDSFNKEVRETTLELIANDPAPTCKAVTQDIALDETHVPWTACGIPKDKIDTLSAEFIYKKFSSCPKAGAGLVWHLGNYSGVNVQKAAHMIQQDNAKAMLSKLDMKVSVKSAGKETVDAQGNKFFEKSFDPVEEQPKKDDVTPKVAQDPLALIEEATKKPALYPPDHAQKIKDKGAEVKDLVASSDSTAMKAARAGLCATYFSFGCVSAVNQVVDFMGAKGGHGKIVNELFTNPSYVQGAAIAAKKINTRIKNFEDNPSSIEKSKNNLYDDFYQSYLEAGNSPEKSEQMAWDLMFVYSTRGASMGPLDSFSTKENSPLLASLYTISSGTNYLDSLTRSTGHPYSYPSTVQSTCDYGKPYHFWLPAYLSRMLVKKGTDPKAAQIAAHLGGVGYEFLSTTYGRQPEKSLSTDPTSNYNNSLRINLAYNDAGAVFGTNILDPKKQTNTIDITKGIGQMFHHAEYKEPLTDEEAKATYRGMGGMPTPGAYYRWREIIAPDAAIDFFNK